MLITIFRSLSSMLVSSRLFCFSSSLFCQINCSNESSSVLLAIKLGKHHEYLRNIGDVA